MENTLLTKLPIVFVHGRNADSGVWGSLKRTLVQSGYPEDLLLTWDYDTSQSTNEILADKFDQYIRATGHSQIDIICHSLGALPTRWWLKFRDGNTLTRNWISLAGPNHGTVLGYLCALWDQGCKDMTPNSWVISHLNQDIETPGPTHYTTFWSAQDEQIIPPSSTRLAGATNIEVSGLKHNDFLDNPDVFSHILKILAQPQMSKSTTSPMIHSLQ
ncbi:esterase/lipase family protein [Pseudomonas aeruginosa]|nr:hypothetical protein [Pseudomonas aeruginosa]HCL3290471.1 hypothetical protein [Pseudomonas aeruginosa]